MTTRTQTENLQRRATDRAATGVAALQDALLRLTRPLTVVEIDGQPGFTADGNRAEPFLAWVPALEPGRLGDPDFLTRHGVRYAYAAGAMANGIASEALVCAMARAGFLAFFGSAGLSVPRVP
ncbi:MAG: hypothetical protein FJW37_15450, partial [Acidobacteria bacterium]|nr:hypothetical protein [Acidobacteriota bacterium]